MTLGSDDAQSTGGANVLLLHLAALLGSFEGLLVLLGDGEKNLALDLNPLLGKPLHGQPARVAGGEDPLHDVLLDVEIKREHGLLGKLVRIAAKQDVRATARHVRRDGDGPLAARLGDDLRLALVVLRVEHVMLDSALVEDAGELLGVLD